MRRRLAGTVLAAASLLLAAPAAGSVAPDGETTIAYVERSDRDLQILVSVPAQATVDVGDVAVTVAGAEAEATAEAADETTSVRRTAVMVIDTSNSMRGERFAAAQSAALTFLDTVPDDVYVGIVSFDSDVTDALAPSLDRDEARAVIEDLTLSQETRLYDGIQAGLDMAGSEGQRQLLVLSDGADTSDTALDDVTAAISEAEILVNVVGLEQRGAAVDALEELAAAGEGSLINADSGALEQAFSNQADVLARQVLVTAEMPSTVTATDATVTVSLGSDIGVLTAEAFTPIGRPSSSDDATSGPAIAPADPPLVLGDTWFLGGLAAVGLGFLALMLALVPRKQKPLGADELAMSYSAHVARGSHGSASTHGQAGHTTEAVEKVLKANKTLETRIAERLDGAGNDLKPAEWVLVHVAVFLGMGALGMLLSGGNIVLGILFLVLGAFGPWMYLGFKRGRRRKAFERSLPDTLQLMSGSLAAGLSLAQSVDTIVREGQDPISGEFRRVLIETRLGISLDDALEGVSQRFESKDFSWVVMAIRIQRQVGGNLAELLDTVAATIREREYMRRQVAALAAEGKLSAYVLGGLPPAFMVYLLLAKRDYVMPMFTEPMGWVMLAGAGLLLAVGGFWMSRLIKVEV